MKDAVKRLKYPMNLQLFADENSNPEGENKEPKTFTQEEVDGIVRERLARDRKGREDYDEIKARLAETEEKYTVVLTEREAAERRALDAEEARGKALEAANQRLIKAEFKALAQTGAVNIRPDALEDAFSLADLSNVSVDDSGNAVGLEGAVRALVESKPYLVDKTPNNRQIGGDTNGGSYKPDMSNLSPSEKMAMAYQNNEFT